ncbi:SpoIIE family protein phosphatase [Streptomyces sp. NPDC001507]|uniref:SpoIIE family protein phosphatase n=1 Tax=Streptomyces sp. NPDC001507 TaxID=3364579 RepID=UPI00367BD816
MALRQRPERRCRTEPGSGGCRAGCGPSRPGYPACGTWPSSRWTGHGIVEARDAEGREFGRDRFVDFIVRHHSGHQTLHETLRRLMRAVVEHHAGHLDDDATVLLAEWRAGHQDKLMP